MSGASAELAREDATGMAERIGRKEISAIEAVEAAIARLERIDPHLNSVIHPAFEQAIDAARRGGIAGPFAGVPFLMKDVGGEERGRPYCMGMQALKDVGFRADADSYYTRKCRAAGLISLGRTNTPELAMLPTTEPQAFGPTRNPFHLEHGAGGSSGGAAAAVAAGIVPCAHASDGGGSIRIPAAACGLIGLKPTRGRCSFGPQRGERWSGLSTEFVVAKSLRDVAGLLDALAGPMPGDPYAAAPPDDPFRGAIARPPDRLRIGLLANGPGGIDLHAENRAAALKLARSLEGLGHHVEESHPEPLDLRTYAFTYVRVVAANLARTVESIGQMLGRELTSDDMEPGTFAMVEQGRSQSATQHLADLEFVHDFGRSMAAWWESGFDLLLTPTTAKPPPKIGYLSATRDEPTRALGRSAAYGAFTLPFNLTGQPAISLPVALCEGHDPAFPAGLPLGAQLVARTGAEATLLAVGHELEQAGLLLRPRFPALDVER